MTTNSKEQQYRNQFLQTTYDRKVQIRYDRLRLILKENASRISTPLNYINYFIGAIISVCSLLVTLLTSEFSSGKEWIKPIILLVCILASCYYVGYLCYMWRKSKTVEDIIYRIEQDNELDEDNLKKKKRHKNTAET